MLLFHAISRHRIVAANSQNWYWKKHIAVINDNYYVELESKRKPLNSCKVRVIFTHAIIKQSSIYRVRFRYRDVFCVIDRGKVYNCFPSCQASNIIFSTETITIYPLTCGNMIYSSQILEIRIRPRKQPPCMCFLHLAYLVLQKIKI